MSAAWQRFIVNGPEVGQAWEVRQRGRRTKSAPATKRWHCSWYTPTWDENGNFPPPPPWSADSTPHAVTWGGIVPLHRQMLSTIRCFAGGLAQ
jgi:hypothetical protein